MLTGKKAAAHTKKNDNLLMIERANLNPRYTFDTFVVGKNNNFAHAASLAVAESPGEVYIPVPLRRCRTGKDPFDDTQLPISFWRKIPKKKVSNVDQ